MDEFRVRLVDKLDEVGNRLAHVEGILSNWREAIDRLYSKDLAPLIKTISENQRKIAGIEIEIAKLKTKIAIWGTLGVVAGSVFVNLLLQKFTD